MLARRLLVAVAVTCALSAQPLEVRARALLDAKCIGCHGAAQMSGLDLRTQQALQKGGTRGPALPLLLKAVRREGDLKMPPGKTPLSDLEIALLEEWVRAGAPYPGAATAAEPNWWSFKPIPRPAGPRYAELAVDLVANRQLAWRDLAMEQDSQAAAQLLNGPGDLLVWGYRSEIYAISRKPAATRFLDSQPLTGVLADRHLTESRATVPELAKTNRAELITTKPQWIVDGLGPYNPELAITRFDDLRDWLRNYEEVGYTPGSVVYRRRVH